MNQPAAPAPSPVLKFVALGHSHVVALAKGAYALQAKGALFAGRRSQGRFHYLYDKAFEPAFVQDQPTAKLNPAILQALNADAPQFVLASMGGNEHNVLAIVQLYQRYDFILGESPDLPLDDSVEILPEALVRETLREWMEDKIAVLRALRAATALPIVQIEPPPPLPRSQVMAHPKEFFKNAVDLRKLSPDILRHKMWRVQTALYREICAALDVLYIETPPDMIDPDGMLAQKAWGGDATHANDLFGEVMMSAALARVAGAAMAN